jgi:ribosome-dependent ATPase
MAGFIGPDGVGKSSLLATIAGAREIQSGDVRVLGADASASTARWTICSSCR